MKCVVHTQKGAHRAVHSFDERFENNSQEIKLLLEQARFTQALAEMRKVIINPDAAAKCSCVFLQILKKRFWQDHLYDINYDGDFLKTNEYICYLQVLIYSVPNVKQM